MNDRRSQTIQIFLPFGEPRGIRIAEITTRIIKAVCVPRNQLSRAFERRELKNVGLYFLFGDAENAERPKVYIGETEDCLVRLTEHNRKMDFWQTAVVIVGKAGHFTKVHVKFLEWHCIKMAKAAGRYDLQNGNYGGQPHAPETIEPEITDGFEALSILLSALGYPVFESFIQQSKSEDDFYLNGELCAARGRFTEDGFVVFAGARGRIRTTNSIGTWVAPYRQKLISNGIVVVEGEQLVFVKDYIFDTPSGASDVLTGRSTNGWITWKTRAGETLDAVKRNPENIKRRSTKKN